MLEIADVAVLRRRVRQARCDQTTVGLVPTMGYLHPGHTRLLDDARRENGLVVCSIFVNPTQFGPHEDFERYPRDLDRDRALAESHGVDLLFVPSEETMYPGGPSAQMLWVDPGALADHLDGASRPGHFRGVATIVTKLFHMVEPDRAYFGQKDAQQAIILSHMARELSFPVDVRIVPTVREVDGLALSSRNVYLTWAEREQAPALWRALGRVQRLIASGERSSLRVRQALRESIEREAPLARVNFVEVAELSTLQPVLDTIKGDVLVAVAAYFGATRLIDNVMVRFDGSVAAFS